MVTTNGEHEGDLSSDPKGVHPKMWRKGKALCTVGGNVHVFSHYGKQFGDPTRYFLKKNKKKKKKKDLNPNFRGSYITPQVITTHTL